MISMLAAFVLSILPVRTSVTPVETCVWPHTCAVASAQAEGVEPCVWPNTCARS